MNDLPKIKPLGESAVVVLFGNEISEQLNAKAIALANLLECDPFPGFIEAIPAYASTTVFFDAARINKELGTNETAKAFVEGSLGETLGRLSADITSAGDLVEIPTDFSSSVGLDLETVAETCRLSVNELIDIFVSRTYRVYMIGFLPGFAYMGETDERIRVARRDQPRPKVPKGSVGLAGAQTGIYPLESPGGWQIIGRTSLEMFTPESDAPSRLMAGDLVKFVPI